MRRRRVRIKRSLDNILKEKKSTMNPVNYKKHGKKSRRKRWDAILSRLPANKKLTGIEIGVLNGNTAHRILQARPLLTHYMVDPWIAPEAGSSYYKSGDDNARKSQAAHEKAYKVTQDRVAFAGARAQIMRMTSQEAINFFDNNFFDFVFIDGDHSYEGVKLDIELWLPKVKPGGWIGGHDYNHPRLPGVKKAVDEFFMQIEIDDNRTWFYKI